MKAANVEYRVAVNRASKSSSRLLRLQTLNGSTI